MRFVHLWLNRLRQSLSSTAFLSRLLCITLLQREPYRRRLMIRHLLRANFSNFVRAQTPVKTVAALIGSHSKWYGESYGK